MRISRPPRISHRSIIWATFRGAKTNSAKHWYARVKSRPSFRPLLMEMHAGIAPSKTYADLDF